MPRSSFHLVLVAALVSLLAAACSQEDAPTADSSGAGGGAASTSSPSSSTAEVSTAASSSSGAGGSAAGAGGAGAGGEAPGGGGAPWGPDACPETPPGVSIGYGVGEQIPDIVLKDCDGNDFALSEVCGAQALFVFGAFGWCPLCKGFAAQAESVHDAYASQGLASVHVVIEDAQGQAPDAALCQLWRDTYEQEDVITLYDPTGASLVLWQDPSSSLSAFLDRDRVVVSTLQHVSDVPTIQAGIEAALTH